MPKPGSPPGIRWRKGEIIGAGAYGRVYMGMNVDSGELLAVKQVLISVNNVTKEKAQAHIRELEEEVRLLRNLSHPNIVRYLGTAREDEALNILLEFVPGGSIASLLGKFGSFTEPVIRMYTKQLLLGLEYLHSNNILHRDIKGANILVDNKGCIKLADFGASKKVVELATISEAKSMKGTPYWMAPEVIRQTGHNWQADIWSVGCTVIEMATGKPPWSQQFQEVAALFHIGTTKSHPPIPEHLSAQAKAFLLRCLQREPKLRPSAAELLKDPFVTERVPDAPDCNRTTQQLSADRSSLTAQGSDVPSTGGQSNGNTLRNASFNPGGRFSWARRGSSTMNGTSPSLNSKPSGERHPLENNRRSDLSYREDSNCSVRLDSDQNDYPGCSVRLDSVRNDYSSCSVRLDPVGGDFPSCSVRLDSVRNNFPSYSSVKLDSVRFDSVRDDQANCSVRLDSFRNDYPNCSVRLDSLRNDHLPGRGLSTTRNGFLNESFNPMSEPSFANGHSWDNPGRDAELTFRTCDDGTESAALEEEKGVGSLQDDDDVTESKIRAFLDEKALELKRLQTPLYEELYNIWNTAKENGPSESFIAPLSPSPAKHQAALSSRSPSKATTASGGRSIGMRSSRDSEISISSGSPRGTGFPSSNCSPLLEISSPKLNEWKGLLHDATAQHMLPPPSPSLNSERQKLWKEELQQELEMKREEKRKLTRTASTLTNTTQSPNKEKSLQRYGSRLAGCTPPTPK